MWKRFVLGALLIVVLSAGATATAGLLEVKSVSDTLRIHGHKLHVESVITPEEAGKPQTILLIGSDTRKADRALGEHGRSDTMILVRLDPHKEATAVLSVPRDLKVPIHLPNGLTQTDKINAAYSLGGAKLATKTITEVLGIPINHVVNTDFRGFKQAVNLLGCVYIDVDRRYYNKNIGTIATNYADIDIQPGYQKLCGEKALSYVRYRHTDSDLVRSARQQDFLSQAKDQNGAKELFSDRQKLARIIADNTQTDIAGSTEILRLLKLVIFSAGHPLREVHFPAGFAMENGVSYVVATPEQIHKAVAEFLAGKASPGPKGKLRSTRAERLAARKRKKLPAGTVAGLEDATTAGQDQAIAALPKAHFPVYYPTQRVRGSLYVDVPRVYRLHDDTDDHKAHRAYRIVGKMGQIGEYYGIQGTTWTDPPILRQPHDQERIGRRTFSVYYDGNRIARIALVTPRAVYWVANTELRTITNRQMRTIAGSMTHLKSVGGR